MTQTNTLPTQQAEECKEWCGENHCDTNGCSNRVRHAAPLIQQPTEEMGRYFDHLDSKRDLALRIGKIQDGERASEE